MAVRIACHAHRLALYSRSHTGDLNAGLAIDTGSSRALAGELSQYGGNSPNRDYGLSSSISGSDLHIPLCSITFVHCKETWANVRVAQLPERVRIQGTRFDNLVAHTEMQPPSAL